jgi:hypothetical protein
MFAQPKFGWGNRFAYEHSYCKTIQKVKNDEKMSHAKKMSAWPGPATCKMKENKNRNSIIPHYYINLSVASSSFGLFIAWTIAVFLTAQLSSKTPRYFGEYYVFRQNLCRRSRKGYVFPVFRFLCFEIWIFLKTFAYDVILVYCDLHMTCDLKYTVSPLRNGCLVNEKGATKS